MESLKEAKESVATLATTSAAWFLTLATGVSDLAVSEVSVKSLSEGRVQRDSRTQFTRQFEGENPSVLCILSVRGDLLQGMVLGVFWYRYPILLYSLSYYYTYPCSVTLTTSSSMSSEEDEGTNRQREFQTSFEEESSKSPQQNRLGATATPAVLSQITGKAGDDSNMMDISSPYSDCESELSVNSVEVA